MSTPLPLVSLFLLITVAACFLDDSNKSDIHAVKQRLEDEKSKRLLLQNDLEMLMLKVGQLERLLNRQSQDLCSQEQTSTESVYFLARRNAHVTLPKGTTLVFDNVMGNSGGGYSPSTGTFRAPVAGEYLFSVTITCSYKKLAQVVLRKKQENLALILSGESNHGWHDAGSVTVAAHLEKNDEVYVMGHLETSFINGNSFTVFSGIKVH